MRIFYLMLKFTCAVCLLMLATSGYAQQAATGKVSDEGGVFLPGVNVLIKGTSTGVSTDADGNYTLMVKNDDVLIFSFIGYASQEVAVASRTVIDVVLVPDITSLQEVVVVGYGEQRKSNVTSAVSAVSSKELKQSPVANMSNALIGRVPGLIATQRSGEPGADGSNLLIRGISTTGDNAPLIVVDGIPRSFSQIDPNEVESITVLKDASAAAVFGVRGANGVIMVTTKRGQIGKPSLSYTSRYDWQVPTRLPDFLDSYNYALLYNEARTNQGQAPLFSDAALEAYKTGSDRDAYPNTDWVDEVLKSSAMQQYHNVNLSGGADKINYFVSLGYFDQDGLYKSTNFKRYNFRANVDADVTNTTKFSIDIAGRQEDRDYPGTSAGTIFSRVMRNLPTAAAVYSNGLPGHYAGNNPVLDVTKSGYAKDVNNVFVSNLRIVQQLPFVKGLSLKGTLAFDKGLRNVKNWSTPYTYYSYNSTTQVFTPNTPGPASLTETYSQYTSLTTEASINFARTIRKHDLSAMVLLTQTQNKSKNFNAGRINFITNSVDQFVTGSDENQSAFGSADETARRGYIGRLTYGYGGKYLLEANFRYDGSENFPKDKRWGFFPSLALGWRVSEEPWFQNIGGNVIDNLKLKASWGKLGNDAIGRFRYISTYDFSDAYVFGEDPVVAKSLIQGALPNENITWENASMTNIGFELALWNGKITAEADYFFKRTEDILGTRNLSVPVSSGILLPVENIRIVDNRGFDFVVSHQQTIGEVGYVVRLNTTFAKNKLVYADEPENTNPLRRVTGKSLNQFIGYVAEGLFQSDDEIAAAPNQGPGVKPGDIRYKDLDGNNIINGEDQTYIGRSRTPEMVYGISVGVNYKNFDLSVLFQGAERVNAYVANEAAWAFFNGGKVTTKHLDRWTPDNRDATYPRLTTSPTSNNTRFSSYWLKDASYLRLKNVELGYNVPKSIVSRIHLNAIRVYVTGQNLITWDKLDVLDPEGPGAGGDAERGWFYPQQKIMGAGINITF